MTGVDIIARGLGANGLKEANRANERLDMLPRGMVYIGEVNYYKDLPATAGIGEVYSVKYKGETGTEPSGAEYVWGVYDGTEQWIQVGTSYDSLPAQQGGTDVSLVLTGEKYIWNNKQNAITSENKLNADLVDAVNSINKFVTEQDIENWNSKQDGAGEFIFTLAEFTALNAGNPIEISTSDTRCSNLEKDILNIKVTGLNWSLIAGKQVNTAQTIAYTFLDYKESQQIAAIYFLAFIPGENKYTVRLISVSGVFVTREEKTQITTNKNDILSLKNNKQDKNIYFTNISVPANTWLADNTYPDYPYKSTILLQGIDATMIPTMTFGMNESLSGNYSTICNTVINGLEIWSKVAESITIPVIMITKTMMNIDISYQINGAGGYTQTIQNVEYTLTPNQFGGDTLTISDISNINIIGE